jgi:hypothetical protein
MFKTLLATLCLLSFTLVLRAQPAQPLDTSQEMPRATLEQLYRTELGDLFDHQPADLLYEAHQHIESYFRHPGQRAERVRSLEATGIDPNALGRLVRIRMHWPDLAGGVYYVNEKLGPHNVHYFLGVPRDYDRTRSWPLVIKLPAAGAFVAEPRADAEQVRQIYTSWITDELARHPDAIVLMPLLNLDELWGPSYVGMNSVIQPMHHVADRVNINPSRVYLLGHSMSAHATWNLALHYPTYFASICALAGGAGAEWQRIRMMNLGNVLPVVWHDTADDIVKVDSSRRLVRILRSMKIPVEYEETRGMGHVPPQRIVEKCYERMRGKARELFPKQVAIQSNRMDTMFNRNDWLQVYQPSRPGDEVRLNFQRGSGYMTIHPNIWKLDARLEPGNRITTTATNVESMRFYLNDQMIDLGKPVAITVNRRRVFEGVLKLSIEEMLKDQLFLGRGWRYYTAVVDIDFGARTPPSTRPGPTATPPAAGP